MMLKQQLQAIGAAFCSAIVQCSAMSKGLIAEHAGQLLSLSLSLSLRHAIDRRRLRSVAAGTRSHDGMEVRTFVCDSGFCDT